MELQTQYFQYEVAVKFDRPELTRTRVIQIIPRLPPLVCGVGDHARAIGNELSREHNFAVSYIGVAGAAEAQPSDQLLLERPTKNSLLDRLVSEDLPPNSAIVLHFSGYGYQKNGLCLWLVKALELYRLERPDVSLVTMFHELWANGKLFSRAMIQRPIQKQIIRRLTAISSAVRTSRQEYGNWLTSNFRGHRMPPLNVQPVVSNFGELEEVPDWNDRKNQIVAFQPPPFGQVEGAEYWQTWQRVCELLPGIQTIVAGRYSSIPGGANIHIRGYVSAAAASEILRESRFALTQYFDGYLAKSSLFAGLAAHGPLCVMPAVNQSQEDGLFPGVHYAIAQDLEVLACPSRCQELQLALFEWYQSHGLAETAASYANAIVALNVQPNRRVA